MPSALAESSNGSVCFGAVSMVLPRTESVHNTFAGRPVPMVWRPSGETTRYGLDPKPEPQP
jgi:hypothetical protein